MNLFKVLKVKGQLVKVTRPINAVTSNDNLYSPSMLSLTHRAYPSVHTAVEFNAPYATAVLFNDLWKSGTLQFSLN